MHILYKYSVLLNRLSKLGNHQAQTLSWIVAVSHLVFESLWYFDASWWPINWKLYFHYWALDEGSWYFSWMGCCSVVFVSSWISFSLSGECYQSPVIKACLSLIDALLLDNSRWIFSFLCCDCYKSSIFWHTVYSLWLLQVYHLLIHWMERYLILRFLLSSAASGTLLSICAPLYLPLMKVIWNWIELL